MIDGNDLKTELLNCITEFSIMYDDQMKEFGPKSFGEIFIGEPVGLIQFARNASNSFCSFDSYSESGEFSFDFDKQNEDPNQVLPELVLELLMISDKMIPEIIRKFEGIRLSKRSPVITLFVKGDPKIPSL